MKEPKQVSFADSEAAKPAPVSYYGVSSQEGGETRDESYDTAEEIHKSLLVEERLFSACYQQTQTWKQRREFKEKKVEDCTWTPVIEKRKRVWWLLEVNHDLNKEHVSTSLEEEAEVAVSVFLPSERTYLATTPQLTPEIVEELLEHFMDPVNGSN